MKKLIYSLAVMLTMGMASCSQDTVEPATDGGQVTFTVSLPGKMASRADFGDGTTAGQKVTYYVYDQANGDNAAPVLSDEIPMTDLIGDVTLHLVIDHTYDVVFLAKASESPYTYSENARTLTADYSNVVNSNENLDAFYKVESFKVNGNANRNVILTRPFAQLNIGTDDITAYEAATGTIKTTEIKVSKVFNTLNLMDGSVSGDAEVTFKAAAIPTGQTFPVKYTNDKNEEVPYGYLAMDYLLVNEKSLVEVEMTVANEKGSDVREYNNIPVQRNYRTNIYGSLLTAVQNFNVEIKPGFAGDHNILVATPEELVDAVKEGGEINLIEDIALEKPLTLTADKPATINLNANNLTIETNAVAAINKDQSLVINGTGTEVIAVKGNNGFRPQGEGTLEINNVIIEDQANVPEKKSYSMIFFQGEKNNIVIRNTTLRPNNGAVYAISTNASKPDKDRENKLILENVKVIPSVTMACPVLLNTKMTVEAKKCEFEGCNSAVILRGGTYTFENCTFTQTLAIDENHITTTTKADIKNTYRNQNRNAWGQGGGVPLAAVTMGNKGGSYQYPTVVTMKGCTINIPDVAKNTNNDLSSSLPAVYIHANTGEGLGVTFNYDNTTTINGDLEWGSNNITINGEVKESPKYN